MCTSSSYYHEESSGKIYTRLFYYLIVEGRGVRGTETDMENMEDGLNFNYYSKTTFDQEYSSKIPPKSPRARRNKIQEEELSVGHREENVVLLALRGWKGLSDA